MKKIALYILCGVTALFTSCDPSLLDLQNENTLSTAYTGRQNLTSKPV